MRIIGGTAKGRRLASFKGMSIRPTTDKVREAIFNILHHPEDNRFPFKNVLDLFAGTGAMGIEALSKGAETVTFVDNDPKAVKIIKKNLDSCGFAERAVIIDRDVQSALKLLSKKGEKFDLIIIDPPYNSSLTGAALNHIDDNRFLNTDGIIVAESSKRIIWDGGLKDIELFDRRKYGDTVVSFYRNKQSATS
ncbi:MAG: 16S rRNA (guanine(966)-N(2))-methyltransferase RsmD [Deltaproteobacteria bacterium]|nr:16S rRNA (guanine(966)-N(2))-methyltransferase RsmD [Deltaproteobacteria bacterium]